MTNTAQKLTVFRAFLVVLKWTLFGAVPLAGGYYVVAHVVRPVRDELQRPKSTPATVDKEASVLVQAVQQARVVTAKHDANTDYVNEITDGAGAADASRAGTAGRKMKPTTSLRSTAGLSHSAAVVELLKITAVIDGAPPRLLLDGKVVRPGELVSEELELRFKGLDAMEHAVLFASRSGEIFRRRY